MRRTGRGHHREEAKDRRSLRTEEKALEPRSEPRLPSPGPESPARHQVPKVQPTIDREHEIDWIERESAINSLTSCCFYNGGSFSKLDDKSRTTPDTELVARRMASGSLRVHKEGHHRLDDRHSQQCVLSADRPRLCDCPREVVAVDELLTEYQGRRDLDSK